MIGIEVIDADITRLKLDAIVNAANQTLQGGGGVDGAIHRAAGPELFDECELLGGCPTGEARITSGHKLPATYIIHAVGPIWRGGQKNEDELLASCYRNSLILCMPYRIKSIAFPAISTGAYGFPIDRAARIAADTVYKFLEKDQNLERVIFCCFGPAAKQVFAKAVRERHAKGNAEL